MKRASRRPRRWLWPVVLPGTYVAGVLVVTAAEYVSEMAKIGRGTFTDTFSPYLVTNLLTLPVSAFHPNRVEYPATFSATTFRDVVRQAMLPTLVNIVVEAVTIAAIVLMWSSLRRRHEESQG